MAHRGGDSVSYTHLDVYKRQGLSFKTSLAANSPASSISSAFEVPSRSMISSRRTTSSVLKTLSLIHILRQQLAGNALTAMCRVDGDIQNLHITVHDHTAGKAQQLSLIHI